MIVNRDLYGKLATVVALPSGRWIRFQTNANHLVTSAEDSSGRSLGYSYLRQDEFFGPYRLQTVADPTQSGLPGPIGGCGAAGGRLCYGWSTNESFCTPTPCSPSPATYLTEAFDRRGNRTFLTDYDPRGRVSQQSFANDGTFTFDYSSQVSGCLGGTRVVDPVGSVTCVDVNGGDVAGITTAQGTPQERTITYTDPANGTPASVEETFVVSGSPRTRRTDYLYDGLGNLAEITFLAGTGSPKTWSYDHDIGYNLVTKIIDPLLHERTFAYSLPEGCLTRIEAHDGDGVSFTCQANGLVKTITSDLAGSPTTTFTYASGDLTKIVDPLGNTTSRFVGADGTVRAATDPLGYTTAMTYDLLGQLTKVTPVSGSSTSFLYDAEQNLTRITLDATNAQTNHAYNGLNLVSSRTDPLNRQETFAYDAAGMLTRSTDRRGVVTKYCTDAAGNVAFIGYGFSGGGEPACTSSFASTTTLTHDGAGRLSRVVDSVSGTITRTYDDLDRLTNETTPQGSITSTYDDANRRQTMTVAGQPTIDYDYFTDDRLKTITRGANVVSLTYDDANRPDTTTLPNGVIEDWTLDAAGHVTGASYQKPGQASLGALSYGHDAAGRPTTVWGASSRITLPAATSLATYDAANRLTTWNGTAMTYDHNGNLATSGTQKLRYNERNQLCRVTTSTATACLAPGQALQTGDVATYAYDGLGRRFEKNVSGSVTRALWDGPNVAQELSVTNVPTFNLLTGFAPDQIFWRQGVSGANTVTNSLLHDGLGSTLATTTPAATPAVRDAFTYEPHGKPNSSAFPYLFTGRDYDAATGLQYNRARSYAPGYGRFTSEDPIGIVGGSANPYLYAGNAPTVFTDPLGLEPGGAGLPFLGVIPPFLLSAVAQLATVFAEGLGQAAVVLLGAMGGGALFGDIAGATIWGLGALGIAVPGAGLIIVGAVAVGIVVGGYITAQELESGEPFDWMGFGP